MLNFEDLNKSDQTLLYAKRRRDRDSWEQDVTDLKAPVTPGELCYLERVRQRRKLKDCADEMGITHVTLIRRERNMGDVHKTVHYWRVAGRSLPRRMWDKAESYSPTPEVTG